MRTKGNALLVFVTVVSVALVTVVQTLPPSPLPVNAPPAEFSAGRAIEHIRVIAAQPRPTGSSAYEAARNYLLAELRDLGLETETQRLGALQNTIAWIEGDSSSDIVLLTAHLDTVAQSPGASDDGSADSSHVGLDDRESGANAGNKSGITTACSDCAAIQSIRRLPATRWGRYRARRLSAARFVARPLRQSTS